MLGGAGARREAGQGGRSASSAQVAFASRAAPQASQGPFCAGFRRKRHPQHGSRYLQSGQDPTPPRSRGQSASGAVRASAFHGQRSSKLDSSSAPFPATDRCESGPSAGRDSPTAAKTLPCGDPVRGAYCTPASRV